MRTALLFGALLGVLQTVATLIIHACGLHSAPESLKGAHSFEKIAAFVAMMACLIFGLRSAKRALAAQGRIFSFGLGTKLALVIATLGGFLNGLGQYLYVAQINPAYSEHLRAALIAGSRLTPEEINASQAQLDFVTSALFRSLSEGATTFFFTLLIGAAYAFLFRERPAPATPAPAKPAAFGT